MYVLFIILANLTIKNSVICFESGTPSALHCIKYLSYDNENTKHEETETMKHRISKQQTSVIPSRINVT